MITLEKIDSYLQEESIINIVGKSGVGKTTFALQYIGQNLPQESYCVWIQAGEKFPKKRFQTIFSSKKDAQLKLQNIIVVPGRSLIQSVDHQEEIIEMIINNLPIDPRRIEYVVVDNISHHLRSKILETDSIQTVSDLLDTFFNQQLFPLISFCFLHNIQLLLIHESTYNPENDKERAFSYSLFSRIDSLWIIMKEKLAERENVFEIKNSGSVNQFHYIIDTRGIIFY